MRESYNVIKLESSNYKIITEHDNEYVIYFSKYWQQDLIDLYSPISLDVYELYFEPVKIVKKCYDSRISYTVMSILQSFLIENRCAVFYATQRDDGRDLELFNLYRFWLRSYVRSAEEPVWKIDRVVLYEGIVESYISCVILKKDIESVSLDINITFNQILTEIFPRSNIISI